MKLLNRAYAHILQFQLKIILNLRIYCSWRIITKADIGYSNLFAIYEPLFAELYTVYAT